METVPILCFVKILSITPSWRSRGSRSGWNKTFSSTSGRGLGLLLPCFHAPSFVSTYWYTAVGSPRIIFSRIFTLFSFRLILGFMCYFRRYIEIHAGHARTKSHRRSKSGHISRMIWCQIPVASHHFKNSYFIEHLFSSSYIELLGASLILRTSFPQVIRKLEYAKLFG